MLYGAPMGDTSKPTAPGARPHSAAIPSFIPAPLGRPFAPLFAYWNGPEGVARGVALVSAGSLTLVVMAIVVKFLGERLPSSEVLLFRATVGFLVLMPAFARDPFQAFRTKHFGMHAVRGTMGALGNLTFFWTITHLLLADAMALQFSRPLFMIPLALIYLQETVSLQRIFVSIFGFCGILLYARPFTSGFDPGVLVGAMGAFFGAIVVIGIKQLAKTESTRVIMFYYAVFNSVFAAVPAFWYWVTPSPAELPLLILVGILGMAGQTMITHGLSQGDATVLVPLDYSRILYSAALGYLLFGELPGAWSFAGMGLILASSLYLVLTERRRRK